MLGAEVDSASVCVVFDTVVVGLIADCSLSSSAVNSILLISAKLGSSTFSDGRNDRRGVINTQR